MPGIGITYIVIWALLFLLYPIARVVLLYYFIQFVCHASQAPKFTNFFVPVTGHLGYARTCQKSHKTGDFGLKWAKKRIFHLQRLGVIIDAEDLSYLMCRKDLGS